MSVCTQRQGDLERKLALHTLCGPDGQSRGVWRGRRTSEFGGMPFGECGMLTEERKTIKFPL